MNDKAPPLLVVTMNATPMLEYDRSKNLSQTQKQSLLLMEEKLAQGISLHGQFIAKPTLEQRIEFVTANLISAVIKDEEVMAAASCAYVAQALPELLQIKAVEKQGEVTIELVFDKEYQPEEKLSFIPLDKIQKHDIN